MVEALLFSTTAAACLWAALRAAAAWVGGGWPRVATAAALLGALAALVPAVSGLIGIGASPWALAGLSLAVALPAGLAAGPAGPLGIQAPPRWGRASLGAAGGLLAAQLVALLLRPEVRTDSYHLTEVVRWLHLGTPGSSELVVHEWPAGAYPLTNELVLTWFCGIARSFVPALLLTPVLTALLGAAVLALLRSRGLGLAAAALGALAVVLIAATTATLDAVGTDLPAIAWLAVSASLVCHRDPARRHPGAAAIALGLSAGTKTPSLIVGAVVLVAMTWPLRRRLVLGDIGGALAGAALCVPWPLRNLLEHGSPMYPFSSFGVGDPVPFVLTELQTSFLDAPVASAEMYLRYSTGDIATAALVLGGAIAVAAAQRRREVVFAALLAAFAMLVWAASPITGQPEAAFEATAQSSIRYGLSAVATGAVAVALALGGGSRLAGALLAAVCAGCLYLLPLRMFISHEAFAGAVAAAGAGALLAWRGGPWPRIPRPVAAGAAVVAVAVACLAAAGGVMRPVYGEGAQMREALEWLDGQPAFRDGEAPVVATWRPDGRMAGPRLRHDVRLLPTESGCDRVRRAAMTGWLVVLRRRSYAETIRPARGEECLRGVVPAFQGLSWSVYVSEEVRDPRSAAP